MSYEEATRIKLDIFQTLGESTHVDPDTSLWYMAYLYDQGHELKEIRSMQEGINDLMKNQLRTYGG